MAAKDYEAYDVETRTPLTVLQRIWFALTLLTGIAYIVAIPPFESGDELTHWNRLWAVAEGEIICRTMPGAAKVIPNFFRFPAKSAYPKVTAEDFRLAWNFTGLGEPGGSGDLQCKYPPTAYVLPAIAARLVALREDGTPRQGGMLASFYAARMVNWMLTSIAMLWLLQAMPWGRNLLLLFYSLPEVLQQGMSVNNDAFLFAMTFLILGVLLRPAAWSNVAWIAVALIAMTTIKPVYAPMALLAAPLYLYLRSVRWTWKQDLITIGLVTPLLLWKLWSMFNTYDTTYDWRASWANPALQGIFLRQNPLHIFVICWAQFKDFFGNGMLSGSWKSVIGLFGWTAFYMATIGYYLVIAAFVLALTADATNGVEAPPIGSCNISRWLHNLCWILAVCGVLLVLPGITVAMYLVFTSVGSNDVLGVQGRYFLTPFLLLVAIWLYGIKRQWGMRTISARWSPVATVMSAALMLVANVLSLVAIHDYFWMR
jgi:uncharacterized membrane protein